mgnify:CR=1 FL=1
MREASKESFVVGYENDNGSLVFYSDLERAPITFDTYSRALRTVVELEEDVIPFPRSASDRTRWQVYKMKFEVVGSVPF